MKHITTNTSAATDAQVAIRKAVILLGDRREDGALKHPDEALERVHALLDGIYNELDHLSVALYASPRVHGALRAAVHALGHASTVADTESRLNRDLSS
jgi:hypothetical protein